MISTAAVQILQGKPNKFTCICCRIKFDSPDLQRAHFKTEWHSYNLKRRICSLEPFDLESFNEIQAVQPEEKDDDQTSILSGASSFVKLDLKEASSSSSDSSGSDDDWERIDGDDEFLDEDYDDDEVKELLAKVIKSDTCLFCDKKGPNMKDNIRHMSHNHGFFLPEERYLIDLDGMMEYLGFKVGAGATCLWCNKQFSSLHGVRLHMMYKDHCKISYDQEKAIEEFKEFYDYSTQEQIEMKPVTELVTLKRRRRRSTNSESNYLVPTRGGGGGGESGGDLMRGEDKTMAACQARSAKRFRASRAKILLKTANSNNQTLRARLRRQNPI